MQPQYYQSPGARGNGVNKKLVFGIIGGVAALIIGVSLIIASSSGGSGQTLSRVVARHNALITTMTEADKKIVSGELRRINSDAVLFLTTDAADLTATMQQNGLKAVPKEIAAAEADSKSTIRLTAADAAGRFDDVYVAIISQKITAHQALLTEAQGAISSTKARSTLKTTYEHLEHVQQQLEKL